VDTCLTATLTAFSDVICKDCIREVEVPRSTVCFVDYKMAFGILSYLDYKIYKNINDIRAFYTVAVRIQFVKKIVFFKEVVGAFVCNIYRMFT
jgi:hypothetical protein